MLPPGWPPVRASSSSSQRCLTAQLCSQHSALQQTDPLSVCDQASVLTSVQQEQDLQAAASHVPLILLSDKPDSPQHVWQGLDVGAAEVLERPVASSKLRNLWQHVVRRVRPAFAQLPIVPARMLRAPAVPAETLLWCERQGAPTCHPQNANQGALCYLLVLKCVL